MMGHVAHHVPRREFSQIPKLVYHGAFLMYPYSIGLTQFLLRCGAIVTDSVDVL